jgi:hypothetical protein
VSLSSYVAVPVGRRWLPVAKRRQAGLYVVVGGPVGRAPVPGLEARHVFVYTTSEPLDHRPCVRRSVRRTVVLLRRIGRPVVQFDVARVDVLDVRPLPVSNAHEQVAVVE